jgi:hypothetical protein
MPDVLTVCVHQIHTVGEEHNAWNWISTPLSWCSNLAQVLTETPLPLLFAKLWVKYISNLQVSLLALRPTLLQRTGWFFATNLSLLSPIYEYPTEPTIASSGATGTQSQSHVTTDDIYCFIDVGRPLWREFGSVICNSHLNCFSSVILLLALPATLSRTAFCLPSSHRRGTSTPTTSR